MLDLHSFRDVTSQIMGENITANYIKGLRRKLGLTQAQFAELVGIKRFNLANYETRAIVPGDVLLRIQATAGVLNDNCAGYTQQGANVND